MQGVEFELAQGIPCLTPYGSWYWLQPPPLSGTTQTHIQTHTEPGGSEAGGSGLERNRPDI